MLIQTIIFLNQNVIRWFFILIYCAKCIHNKYLSYLFSIIPFNSDHFITMVSWSSRHWNIC